MKNNTLSGKILFTFFLFVFYSSNNVIAAKTILKIMPSDSIEFDISDSDTLHVVSHKTLVKTNKFTAIVFAILTGPLGGHRVYLGTTTKVPLIYTITLGGFGTMVVADIIAILVTKNISEYENNNHLFMWMASNNKN